jgi:hypothetical protein
VLAYVFWHAPGPDVGATAYESALGGFHEVLRDDPPEGFVRSAAMRVAGAPWLPEGVGYEDWYLVEGFAALGELNEAAVSGRRRAPHDGVAIHSAGGAGGIYSLWTGAPDPPSGPTTWCAKAPGTTYDELGTSLRGTAWLRQLLLGPAPELCLPGDGPTPDGADVLVRTTVEVVWPTAATPTGP